MLGYSASVIGDGFADKQQVFLVIRAGLIILGLSYLENKSDGARSSDFYISEFTNGPDKVEFGIFLLV
jgi:hypothetical protein